MLLGLIRILYHLPYRQLEGFIRALAKYVRTTSTRLHHNMQNKQTINRRNFSNPRTPSSRFIGHKSAQRWGLDEKGMEGEEGLKMHFAVWISTKRTFTNKKPSRSWNCNRIDHRTCDSRHTCRIFLYEQLLIELSIFILAVNCESFSNRNFSQFTDN